MEPRHRRLAEIALAVVGDQGFALAGGYALRAHGMGNRPQLRRRSLHRRADFPRAVNAVVAELQRHGYDFTAAMSGETFARLLVSSADGGPDKLEMSADCARPSILLEIGPVLHPDDAVANKMCVPFGRALSRDSLDIEAALASGRYGHDRLLELARSVDDGFDPRMFADALGALTQITDDTFAEYGVPSEDVDAMRKRFADWRRELLATSCPSAKPIDKAIGRPRDPQRFAAPQGATWACLHIRGGWLCGSDCRADKEEEVMRMWRHALEQIRIFLFHSVQFFLHVLLRLTNELQQVGAVGMQRSGQF
ncbi:hypothetical protein [Nocardia sp. BMG51109]|uniref:hypothetical protein n=1 Tax=Nocardia sp. BMG51109 TaxID=1056816 RepID=UPI0004642F51|nr:hypothetical protein [Nocardia sp. BMG51109]